MSYARGTTVTAQQTIGEILGLLGRRGVSKTATFNEPDRFTLAFEYESVPYRLSLPLPDPADPKFTEYYKGSVLYGRTETAAKELYTKELNRRWRAFGMVIKAKLVAAEEGISTLEAEFVGNVILHDGRTVAETYAHALPALVREGRMAQLALPGGRTK